MCNKKVYSVLVKSAEFDIRVLKENRSLHEAGYDVTLLAVHKNGFPFEDNSKGFRILNIRTFTSNWENSIFLKMIEFSAFIIKAAFLCRKADIIHCNDLKAMPVAFITKFILCKKVKVVYDAHEYESNQNPDQSKFSIKLHMLFEKLMLKAVDAMITVSPSIAELYSKNFKVPKPYLVLNCPYFTKPADSNYLREKFAIPEDAVIFIFLGFFMTGRNIRRIFDFFKELDPKKYCLVFMGPDLDTKINPQNIRYKNIFFHPSVSHDKLHAVISSADAGIIPYEKNCLNHIYCYPNKLFQFIMAGIPIIANDLYDVEELINTQNIGYIVKDFSADNFHKCINNLNRQSISSLKDNLRITSEKYSWEVQEKNLLRAYSEILKNPSTK